MSNHVPASHADILESTAIGHLATIGADGLPQSTPIWFIFDGEHVKFSVTKTRQKYGNITQNPNVAISITDPANPYRYIEVRGQVNRIDDDPEFAFINSCAQKYLGSDYPWTQPGDERVVGYITPTRSSSMG